MPSAFTSVPTCSNAVSKREAYTASRSKSREETIHSWHRIVGKMSIAKKVMASVEHKKNLKKMWKQSYAGMCNRAIVLDKVVHEANKQGVKIKPLVISNIDQLNSSEVKSKKYIGLGKKFYTLKDKKTEDQPNPELLQRFTSLTEAQIDDNPGPGGLLTLRSNASNFRLNVRTRSLDVLLEAPARRIRIFEHKKRSSLHLTINNIDEQVHESLVSSSSSRPTRRDVLSRIDRNSLDSCNTEVSRLLSMSMSCANEPLSRPPSSPRAESPEARPVERAIEARSGSEDGLGSMVRCIHFAETFIKDREYFIYIFYNSEVPPAARPAGGVPIKVTSLASAQIALAPASTILRNQSCLFVKSLTI